MSSEEQSASPSMPDTLIADARRQLTAVANDEDAVTMAAYMKTEQPFWGVKKPGRKPILKVLKRAHRPTSIGEWAQAAHALWGHGLTSGTPGWSAAPRPDLRREEQYLAVSWAEAFKPVWLRDSEAVPGVLRFVECCVRTGAWWDLVDHAVMRLLSPLYRAHRARVKPTIEAWIDDDDVWVRRAAIISQLKHKHATDADQLFEFCRRRAGDSPFWIRKAIGWALRDYSYAAPEAVRDFLVAECDQLSGLSVREGAKQLTRAGYTLDPGEAA